MTTAKIQDMQEYELAELIQVGAGFFGNFTPSSASLTAFGLMLRQKFPLMTGEKVIKLCTDVAANPLQGKEIKFTPSFLATILQSQQKEFRPLNYTEREASIEEKIKYRQQFLKDLYADFELHKAGKRMINIIVWDYVARQLVGAGYAERLPEIKHEQTRGEKSNIIRNTYSSQEGFVTACFDKMIKSNQHISEIIHGLT